MRNQAEIIQFSGLMSAANRRAVPVFVTVRYKEAAQKNLEVEIGASSRRSKNWSIWSEIGAYQGKPIIIRDPSNKHGTLTLEDVYNRGGADAGAIINVGSFSYGFTGRFVNPKDDVYLTYGMVPSGILGDILYRQLNPDGSIKIKRQHFKSPYWTTDMGEFVCSETYQYFEDDASPKPRQVVEPSTTVVLKYCPERRQELRKIRDDASKYIDSIRALLCLSSRRWVRLYAIDAFISSSGNTRNSKIPYVSPVQRFGLHRGEDSSDYAWKEPLLEVRNISGKKFDKLAKALTTSDIKDDLKTAIHFLAISREGYLEAGYFFCFAALDSLTGAIIEWKCLQLDLPKDLARKLRKEMIAVIDATEFSGYESIGSEMKNRLSDLTRVPMRAKIAEVVKLLKVQTDDLWRPWGFSKGIKEAVEIRNELFHGAKVSSYPKLSSNLVRLQFLTERIILRALSWNMKDIWVHNDQELKGVNRMQP